MKRFQRFCIMFVSCLIVTQAAQSQVIELDDEFLLNEIIVEANKRPQNLQSVSQSVTALSGASLGRELLTDTVSLSGKAPNLLITTSEGYQVTGNIRGSGRQANQNARARPAVPVYYDGYFSPEGPNLKASLYDIERVEINRGPQDTLFGQNSTGGTINVIAEKPDLFDFGGYLTGRIGNYRQRNLEGAFNVPLGDTVATRVSFLQQKHDGYTENLAIPGHDLDDQDDDSWRIQTYWEPTGNFSTQVMWSHYQTDINGRAQKGSLDLSSSDPRELSHDLAERFTLDTDLYGVTFRFDTRFASLRLLANHQVSELFHLADMDRTALTANDPAPLSLVGDIDTLGEAPVREAELSISQEFRNSTIEFNISSPSDNQRRFSWIAGTAIHEAKQDSNVRNFGDFERDGNPLDRTIHPDNVFINGDVDFLNANKNKRKNLGVFFSLTYNFSPNLSGTIGARYTEDKVDNRICTYNCLNTGERRRNQVNDYATTGKLALEWDLSSQSMLYALASQGYKPHDTNNTFSGFIDLVYKPEIITNYEIGHKYEHFNNRLRLNSSLFYHDVQDYQFPGNSPRPFTGGIDNIEESEVYGLEVEWQTIFNPNLTMGGNFAWMESEVLSSTPAIDGIRADNASTEILLNNGGNVFDPAVTLARGSVAQDLKGNDLAMAPGFMANVFLSYSRVMFDAGELTYTVNAKHIADYYDRIFNNPETDKVDGYTLLGLSILWQPNSLDWEAELIVNNLTNEDYATASFTDNFGVSSTSQEYGPPRTFSLGARLIF